MSVSTVQRASLDLARHYRHHPDDAEGLRERRRIVAETKITEYVRQIVSGSPPLSDEATARITALLRNGVSDG